MTDAIKFPGTEMEVFEKYPLSRRLDFPNIGDVCKTAFAKGIITDFEKISDDPIQVKSRVKVEVDGQETDFLPIFYHPKKKFWDDPVVLATDFNEEGGYFEKAWMSFRKDDEVVVMLKEGKPVAVLGFADGGPRPGEDVLKSDFGSQHWWQVSLPDVYPDEDVGPDGNDLGLKLKCERIDIDTETYKEPTPCGGGATSQHIWGLLLDRDTIRYNPVTLEDYSMVVAHVQNHWTNTYKNFYRTNVTKRYKYLIKIGPILYWIAETSSESKYNWGEEETEGVTDGPIVENAWLRHNFYLEYLASVGLNPNGSGPFYPYDYPEAEGYADAWIATYVVDHTNTYPLPPIWQDTGRSSITYVAQALYSQELYDEAMGAAEPPSAFKINAPLGLILGFNELTPSGDWPPAGSVNKDAEKVAEADFQFSTRPHTKAELQAAGMWPAGA